MEYGEIVDKIQKHEYVPVKNVTGMQLLSLVYDKILKDIKYYGTIYEINFIPITYTYEAINITEEEYPTFDEMSKLFEHWIHCYQVNKKIYIKIVDLYYEIVLDILETKE